jgi:hypothetical protein
MYLESGPFHFGMPDEYARGKAREFPDEGSPVILVLAVPDEVVQRSATDWFPLSTTFRKFQGSFGELEA